MKGVFITFEGADGAGKSTQIRKFAAYLEAHGHQVQLTREPGGTPLGDRVRKVVLDPAAGVVDDRTETLLYLASRAQHVAELIIPALSAGKVPEFIAVITNSVFTNQIIDFFDKILYIQHGDLIAFILMQENIRKVMLSAEFFTGNNLLFYFFCQLRRDVNRMMFTNSVAASGL